ncbi:hypothetical protein QA601_14765 [Chitinispirillales bacterium ANBcel5]|uniref:hypothetical protein n=1 Tax=Cellulosispirillum alkaliphilum TaxID=3039283 RepID=UPI002A4E903D|nr:hypothetical protein [Chitinispirillales bacterium ANBcel5]
MKLNVPAMAATCSVVCGFGMGILTWVMMLFERKMKKKTVLKYMYKGNKITAKKSAIGVAGALIDGFVGGAGFSFVYNKFVSLFSKDEDA